MGHFFLRSPDLEAAVQALGLESHPEPALALDGARRIVYLNPAWDRCAAARGGACTSPVILGTPWLSHLGGPAVREAWATLAEVAASRPRGAAPRVHGGKCHSAERYRLTAMSLAALPASGLALWVTTVVDVPISSHYQLCRPGPEHRDASGRVQQCAGCRRVWNSRRFGWDFVPAFLSDADTDEAWCETCQDQFALAATMRRAA
jgi:hypothetical protein